MNAWEKKYRESVIKQNLLREPIDFEEQADISEDKWIILVELLEEQEDQINELKNTIEKQEIMIDKMKSCDNCKLSYYKDVLYCRLTGKEAEFCKGWVINGQ